MSRLCRKAKRLRSQPRTTWVSMLWRHYQYRRPTIYEGHRTFTRTDFSESCLSYAGIDQTSHLSTSKSYMSEYARVQILSVEKTEFMHITPSLRILCCSLPAYSFLLRRAALFLLDSSFCGGGIKHVFGDTLTLLCGQFYIGLTLQGR